MRQKKCTWNTLVGTRKTSPKPLVLSRKTTLEALQSSVWRKTKRPNNLSWFPLAKRMPASPLEDLTVLSWTHRTSKTKLASFSLVTRVLAKSLYLQHTVCTCFCLVLILILLLLLVLLLPSSPDSPSSFLPLQQDLLCLFSLEKQWSYLIALRFYRKWNTKFLKTPWNLVNDIVQVYLQKISIDYISMQPINEESRRLWVDLPFLDHQPISMFFLWSRSSQVRHLKPSVWAKNSEGESV